MEAGDATEVLVVGGGPSGLCAALAAAQDAEVQLFEAEQSLCGSNGRAEIHRLSWEARPMEEETWQDLSELGVVVQATGKSDVVEILRSLTDAVQRSPKIRVHTSSTVRRLLYSQAGCYGCVCMLPDGEVQVKGKVLLCCGGFLSDLGLLRRYRPDLLHWPIPLGLSSAPSAPRLAPTARVTVPRMRLCATAEVPAGRGRRARRLLPRGRLFCRQGKVSASSEEDLAAEVLRQGPCWLLQATSSAPRDSLKHMSLTSLACEMKVSTSWLRKQLESEDLGPIDAAGEEPLFWTAQVTPALLFCEGGLQGDAGAVLAADGRPIPGLFVAGEAAGEGSSIRRCVSSARSAAASAVKATPPEQSPPAAPVEEPEQMEDAMPPIPRSQAAVRLKDFLEKEFTVETLRNALLRCVDGDLEKAAQELSLQLKRRWGLEGVVLHLEDPAPPYLRLSTRPMIAALPQAGELTTEVSSACVHCHLPLKFQVSVELMNGHGPSAEAPRPAGEDRYAYATLLYGQGVEYFLGALVLGWSLHFHGCQADRLLLHTEDVPLSYLDALGEYWSLREVDYLHGDASMYANHQSSRFQDVFTKLQVLSCTDYSKVLMMDLDMLVRGNLDELFLLRAPAALKRCSGHEQPEHGGDFTSEDFYSERRDKMNSGINAGVMLLEPNEDVYHRMLHEIQDSQHPEHLNTFGPEQDYLARFFGCFGCGTWTHLHAKYNYQPNLPDDYVGKAHRSIDVIQDVMVAHYSGGRVKPWKIDGLALNAEGVHRLLEDDSLEALMGGGPKAKVNMGSRVMDEVEIAPRSEELPEEVRSLMWEWVLALRQCDQDLLEGAVDLLFLISVGSSS